MASDDQFWCDVVRGTARPSMCVQRWNVVSGGMPRFPLCWQCPRAKAMPQPQARKAALHRLAAEIEEATPAREGWIVQTETLTDVRGRVYLELLDGTPAEAARGLELLRKAAG